MRNRMAAMAAMAAGGRPRHVSIIRRGRLRPTRVILHHLRRRAMVTGISLGRDRRPIAAERRTERRKQAD
ncbi:hypothetical protein CI15_25060 [Paraburkholderia monticola]|uniref:Uncharacterized protein n=1 Tax=Paraburkholderia monticola TaxID=1399968 RepID=A0A149PFG9_9BURK|nr:hypothetical protein CI15_25060 [Paraburkholderia monticola]